MVTDNDRRREGLPRVVQVGNVLVSTDIMTEQFCCDLSQCHGACCVEGDSGAPLTLDETMNIEDVLGEVWNNLSASAQSVIDRQGVAYTDVEGDLVTSIVNGKDCVFTCYDNGCCLCALERAYRNGRTDFVKPISCALYPIREKDFGDNVIGINYNRWSVCKPAVEKGRREDVYLYQFLREPLTRRFGETWYDELLEAADAIQELQTKKGR